jgi:hypothetical protein
MTRHRNRIDQARQLQRENGTRRAPVTRAHGAVKQRAQPVQGLLAGTAIAVARRPGRCRDVPPRCLAGRLRHRRAVSGQ